MKSTVTTWLFLLVCIHASAQLTLLTDERVVRGRIVDAFTHEPVTNASICLLSAADSTVLATYVPVNRDTFIVNHFGTFQMPVKEKGKYLLRISCIGYKTTYTPFEVKYKRQGDIDLRRIEMKPESRQLNEVTVTGTKIKMVMHGDTIVYNAEAFNLAEGSMLDALISQLPGAELNKNGEIKVNGKKIDHLLVDGRDFFEGDPKAALENLPAYTVNKVKVFDRTGKTSLMMGRDMGDRSYVMDVRLKKIYAVGVMGNVTAGVGTDNRYGVRGLAVRTAGKGRLSATANLNNLNNTGEPTIMAVDAAPFTVTQPSPLRGVNTLRNFNLGYSYGNFEDKLSMGIHLTGASNSSHTDTWTSSQTYLTGGDTYSRSADYARNNTRSLSGVADLRYSPESLVSQAMLGVAYNAGDGKSRSRSANYDADPALYGALLDSLFLHPERYRDMTLNMNQNRSKNDNENITLNGEILADIKVMADVVSLRATTNYNHSSSHSYQLSDLRYLKAGDTRDFRNNYTNAPSTSFDANIQASYNLGLGRHNLAFSYDYRYNYSDNENSLYRLDRLEGRSSDTPLDLLPSTADALRNVLDATNSYYSTRYDNLHNLSLSLRLSPRFLGNGSVSFNMPIAYKHKRYDYFRQTQQNLTQSNWAFNPSINIIYLSKADENQGINLQGNTVSFPTNINATFNASLTTTEPDITSLVVYRDDSNPLNVRLSNAHLRQTRQFTMNGMFNIIGGPHMRSLSATLSYSRSYDAVATSMIYDKESGRTTTQPVNVNGNWNTSASLNYGQFLDKKQKWSIKNNLVANYNHSVDLNSVEGTASSHSIVHNTSLSDNVTAEWTFGKGNKIALNGNCNWSRATSDREDFLKVNAFDISYGGMVQVQLPWQLQFRCTLNNYSRRGYSDPQMNTNELILGMRISRPLLKKKLSISLEGFDLLGQLSNRQYTINSQGRTENYTNVISQYALLKLTWHFNKFPKKKK